MNGSGFARSGAMRHQRNQRQRTKSTTTDAARPPAISHVELRPHNKTMLVALNLCCPESTALPKRKPGFVIAVAELCQSSIRAHPTSVAFTIGLANPNSAITADGKRGRRHLASHYTSGGSIRPGGKRSRAIRPPACRTHGGQNHPRLVYPMISDFFTFILITG